MRGVAHACEAFRLWANCTSSLHPLLEQESDREADGWASFRIQLEEVFEAKGLCAGRTCLRGLRAFLLAPFLSLSTFLLGQWLLFRAFSHTQRDHAQNRLSRLYNFLRFLFVGTLGPWKGSSRAQGILGRKCFKILTPFPNLTHRQATKLHSTVGVETQLRIWCVPIIVTLGRSNSWDFWEGHCFPDCCQAANPSCQSFNTNSKSDGMRNTFLKHL